MVRILNRHCQQVHKLGEQGNKVKSEQKKVIVKGQVFNTSRVDNLNSHRAGYRVAVFLRPLEAILPNNSYASQLFPSIIEKNNQVILQNH